MSDDYISREAALAALHNRAFDKADTGGEYRALVWAARQIKSLPTIDAVPVVRGKWKGLGPIPMRMNFKCCSECGELRPIDNFCSNCGADMREEIDHD